MLYVDYEGHPAPLTECFFSRCRISSTLHRYPLTTVTEVDSAYCPQCLSFHDKVSAARLLFCPRASCKRCPLCRAICSIGADEEDHSCYYECVTCKWTSKECDLSQKIGSKEDGSIDTVEIARAHEELGLELERRRLSMQKDLDEHFRSIQDSWAARLKTTSNPKATPMATSKGEWSIEALEKCMKEKRSHLKEPTFNGPEIQSSSFDDLDPDSIDTADRPDTLSFAFQALNFNHSPENRSNLLPLPVSLQPRTSRRCLAEMAEGKPGILVKPKLNPLEGDTSLRTGHGQWWKKDSSAVLVLPNIRVVKAFSNETISAALLKVTNPTIGSIRLRFTASLYKGEKSNSTPDELIDTLDDLLLDPVTRERGCVYLLPLLQGMRDSETVELSSTEDSFLDLGSKAFEIPPEVVAWDPLSIQSTGVSLVTKTASIAYFQLKMEKSVAANTGTKSGTKSVGVPFSVDIDVGGGSWETVALDADNGSGHFRFDVIFTQEL